MRDDAVRIRSTTILAFGVTLAALFLAANVPFRLGLLIYPEQVVLVVLGLAMGLGFLQRDSEGRLAWLDYPLAAASLGVCFWLAYRYPEVSTNFFMHEREIKWTGAILVPLILEVLRRKTGWSLVGIVLAFGIYALFADHVPGTLQGRASPLGDLLGYLAVDSTALLGSPISIVVNIVVIYILFGALLLATGGSAWFTDLSSALVGRRVGGSAKIAVVSSALFGSISGSAVANVASTGVITIPLMKRAGFSPRMAASFEAVASTGGQMMPPVMGAAAFLMAEFLQVSYATVVIAALVPSFLFFLAVMIQVDLEARVRGIPPVPDELIPAVGRVMKAGWYFPLPFAVLIGALFLWNKSPAEAALWAAGAVIIFNLIFGYEGRRITPGSFWNALVETGKGSVEIVVIGAVAGLVIGILQLTGLGFGLTFLLVEFGRGSLFLLLLVTALICVVLGMGMPTTGIYLLVATLAAPPLVNLGVEPISAHFFIFYFGMMSMISPPVAVAAFAAASIAGASPMQTAMTAVRVGWPAFIIPFLFVYSPSLLLQDVWWASAIAFATATSGVWLVSVGLVGYFRDRLSAGMRLWSLVAGLMLLLPADAFGYAQWVEVTGGVLAAAWLWANWKREGLAPPAEAGRQSG